MHHVRQRVFTIDDQAAFAELSGDYNPLHLDEVYSRRLLFGSAIGYGVYSLLWALDCWLEDKTEVIELRSIKVLFLKPIRIGETISLSWTSKGDRHMRMTLERGHSLVTSIEFEWTTSTNQKWEFLKACCPEKRTPRVLLEHDIENRSGSLDLYLDREAAGKIFPSALARLTRLQLSVLLCITRLIGIECPGLHSFESEIRLLSGVGSHETGLKYQVQRVERRFGMVFMDIVAPGMKGAIQAFLRPREKEQAQFSDLKNMVVPGEFAAQRALVVGGCRGLGEVTSKLLAAGSAEVKLTYHQGRRDAKRVVEEIASNGGSAECCQFDVLSKDSDHVGPAIQSWRPTHLYYYATPFISAGETGVFSRDLFRRFCDHYVTGFVNALALLGGGDGTFVFYPSSVFMDDPPSDMSEYVTAKGAGEALCGFIEDTAPEISIYRPRLPKMATDQTVSLLPAENHDPVPILLKHLRHFRDVTVSR
tara:strand:+ start:105 stop:1535 length:1431 start_codon:yes stop_codon:yes gene_type:complete